MKSLHGRLSVPARYKKDNMQLVLYLAPAENTGSFLCFINKTARNNKCSLLLYNFVRTKKSLQLKIDIAAKIMTNIVKEVIVQDAFLQKEN